MLLHGHKWPFGLFSLVEPEWQEAGLLGFRRHMCVHCLSLCPKHLSFCNEDRYTINRHPEITLPLQVK